LNKNKSVPLKTGPIYQGSSWQFWGRKEMASLENGYMLILTPTLQLARIHNLIHCC